MINAILLLIKLSALMVVLAFMLAIIIIIVYGIVIITTNIIEYIENTKKRGLKELKKYFD